MTAFEPYIIIKRLIITKGAKYVYDENFSEGVNIIRGKNSSGKSTIADFIFYALGGDLTKWKNEAKECDYTFLEVSLNGKVFTFKREIKDSGQSGMEILEGCFDKANSSNLWLKYPYRATSNKESYYQVILKELGIPFSRADDNNSITLHQLLRLMYVDQMTSIDRVFKFDRFDSPNKRKAIGELMIGLSDFKLYELRVEAQKVSNELENKIKEIKYLHQFFGADIKTLEEIDIQIKKYETEIDNAESELSQNNKEAINEESSSSYSLRQEIQDLRSNLRKYLDNILNVSFELADSKKFIISLQHRLQALNNSDAIIHELADIGFNYCPSCFSPIKQIEPHHCVLCGDESIEANDNPTFRIRKEIEFQIRESINLIEIKQEKLETLEIDKDIIEKQLESKLRQLNSIEKPLKEVNSKIRQILFNIGELNRRIDEANESKRHFSKLHLLYQKRDTLQKTLNSINDLIEIKESSIEVEKAKKLKMLSTLTKQILRADADHEEIFVEGKVVNIDFAEDRVSIDDRALFSASSMVYLKNAFRLALLEASCLDSSYIYPRFLLMDNVEDKGMEAARSQLFQRQIVEISSRLEVPHQIIFTTSMIDDTLDFSELCVGDKYTDQNKSLKF